MVESLLQPAASSNPAAPAPTPATPAAPAATGATAPSVPAATPPSTPTPAAPASTPPQTPPAAAPTGAPDKYDLKVDQGSAFEGDVRTTFESVAKKHGLSNAAAQELLSEVSPKLVAQRAAQIDSAIAAQRREWHTQSVNHPVWGGAKLPETLATASRALALAGPSLPQFLKDTGLDMHPLIIEWAAHVGRAIAPDRVVTSAPGETAARQTDGQVFFGKVADKK